MATFPLSYKSPGQVVVVGTQLYVSSSLLPLGQIDLTSGTVSSGTQFPSVQLAYDGTSLYECQNSPTTSTIYKDGNLLATLSYTINDMDISSTGILYALANANIPVARYSGSDVSLISINTTSGTVNSINVFTNTTMSCIKCVETLLYIMSSDGKTLDISTYDTAFGSKGTSLWTHPGQYGFFDVAADGTLYVTDTKTIWKGDSLFQSGFRSAMKLTVHGTDLYVPDYGADMIYKYSLLPNAPVPEPIEPIVPVCTLAEEVIDWLEYKVLFYKSLLFLILFFLLLIAYARS